MSTCKNGLPGVPSAGGGICCAPECDKCGGSDCSAQDAGGENCCVDPIEMSGILCSESGAAPCLIDDDQVADEKETDDDDEEADDQETDDESRKCCVRYLCSASLSSAARRFFLRVDRSAFFLVRFSFREKTHQPAHPHPVRRDR